MPVEGHVGRVTLGIQELSEGEVATANGREHVAVPVLGGREGREGVALGLRDETEDGRPVELAKAAAKSRGRRKRPPRGATSSR